MKLSGKDIAQKVYDSLRNRVEELQKKGIIPHLVVFLIGENPASVAYVRQKKLKGEDIGCKITVLNLPESVTTEELEKQITELNEDPSVHGILIQRPVPDHVDIDKLELLTNPQKDIDGFHPDAPYTFPIPLAVMKILEEVHQVEQEGDFIKWLQSKNIVVIGKGPTGGGPIINEFTKQTIPHQLIDSRTQNGEELLKNADIVISAVGKENVVKGEQLKQGVILIGVGILRGADGKLHGDYGEEDVDAVAGYYTTTPGGVGPVNVAMLISNLLTATEKQTNQ